MAVIRLPIHTAHRSEHSVARALSPHASESRSRAFGIVSRSVRGSGKCDGSVRPRCLGSYSNFTALIEFSLLVSTTMPDSIVAMNLPGLVVNCCDGD
jgi:hypothetical protein